jgi:large repetitive protein
MNAPANDVVANLIAANTTDGVFVGGDAAGDIIAANLIGTDISGAKNLGNGQDGIDVVSTTGLLDIGDGLGDLFFAFPASVGDAVRATLLSDGNIIAFNGDSAVSVDPSDQVDIQNNSMFSNGSGAITLTGGSNNNQPAPELTSVTTVPAENGSTTYYQYHIQGALFATPNSSYTIQFFSNASGDDEGETLLGTIAVATDSTGEAKIDASVTALPNGEGSITATATDSQGNTSEFSSAVAASPPPDPVKIATTLEVESSSSTISVGDVVTFTASTAPT